LAKFFSSQADLSAVWPSQTSNGVAAGRAGFFLGAPRLFGEGSLSDLVSLHINDMGYSVADLSKVLMMNETEVARTYSIDLPTDGKGRASHLRIQ
jgi:hypothetical protein